MSDQSQSFNSKSFYGAKCRKLVQRWPQNITSRKRRYEIKSLIEKQVEKQTKYSLPEEFRSRIGGPSSSWKIFYKQNEAFKFTQSTSEDLHVFSYEKEVKGVEKGQRLYLVTSYPVFWHYYRQLSCDKKHHYEIIPEGGVCKVYFDLEYMKEYNPESVGEEMVQIFIKYVCYWLKKKLDVFCDVSNVLNLDASTEFKFSRHLIFHMKNAAFKDNIQLGYFINEMMVKLEDIIKHKEVLSDSGIDISSENTNNNHLDCEQTHNMEDSLGDAEFDKREATLVTAENIQGSDQYCKQQTNNNMEYSLGDAEFDKREATLQNSETTSTERILKNIQGSDLYCKRQTNNNMEYSLSDTEFHKREATLQNSETTSTERILKNKEFDKLATSNLDDKQPTNMNDSLRLSECDKREATLANSEDIQHTNKNDRPHISNTEDSLQKTDVKTATKPQTRLVQDSFENRELSNGEITLADSENFTDNNDMKQPTIKTEDNLEKNEVTTGQSFDEKSGIRLKELNEILEIFNLEDLQTLFIFNKNGDKIPFVDTDDNQFLSSTQEDIFLSSLISNVSYSDEVRILKLCDDEKVKEKGVCYPSRSKTTEATLEGEISSPYPEIDLYIKTIINCDDQHGYVRHWTYFTNGELLIYEIAKYRFCENINRHHRSNNIMYIVDIRRGVYYQKCHDPDCKKQDFKSQEHEIPKEYLPAFLLEQDDFMSNSDDDDVLLQAMENVEKSITENSDFKNFSDCDLSDNELLSITNEIEKSSDHVHIQ